MCNLVSNKSTSLFNFLWNEYIKNFTILSALICSQLYHNTKLLNIYKNTFIYVKRIYIFPNFVYIITQKKRIPLLPGIRIFFYILY